MSRNHSPKARLVLEALEDRCLMAASFYSAPLMVAYSAKPAAGPTDKALVKTISVAGMEGASAMPFVRSADWISGLRPNHNETLVRDAGRKAKSR